MQLIKQFYQSYQILFQNRRQKRFSFKKETFKKEKDEYIDPLVTSEEMASVVAEIKSESYLKLTRLIQYLMREYLIEDIQVERVFESGEDFYRAKLKYKEFPFQEVMR